jgi:hypothetical protein
VPLSLHDWLATTLSVFTIALTLIALAIAGMAIWGYYGIRREARRIAQRVAKAEISSFFDKEEIPAKLKEEIRKRRQEEDGQIQADFLSLGRFG